MYARIALYSEGAVVPPITWARRSTVPAATSAHPLCDLSSARPSGQGGQPLSASLAVSYTARLFLVAVHSATPVSLDEF